ncbi:VOC family protein [Amphiplicatus metriothermophilus]|uniref:Glyoxalase/fosfomycin resistance/dioxygenase domain-containing protein n=1 Tax=Amphiplicatus metriothermophilus TaxID=1519374 RepID=A0A239PZ19_9PROT|nr:VOC family protein [Amphiplicatus metriothermophilus]MBB5518220.1 putative enzyme related to lactoylglutathione lyase [Amphiplicatus metriothermophilus]SNT75410.1 hypothetical protein SAMN06297382_2725 [Amphiplicatus metriothermophilus]
MFEKAAFTMRPVKDVVRARAFYEKIFGLAPGSSGNQRDNWRAGYDLPGGGCFAVTSFIDDAPGAGGAIAFEVEGLDRPMEDLKNRSVEFKSDVIHSPVCRMAVCVNSEGNSILLHQLKIKK